MLRGLTFSFLVASAPVMWGQPVLTLEDAVSIALKNSRPVRNAELQLQKAEAQVAAARTFRLPSFTFDALGAQLLTRLDFSFPRGAFGTFAPIGQVPANDAKITTPRRPILILNARATQPLSQLHRIGLAIRARQASRDISREELAAQRQDVVEKVRKAYYTVLQTESALEANDQAVKLYAELDRVVDENLAQEVVLKSDSLEIKARSAKAEYEAVTLRNTLATAKEQLNELLGRDIATEFGTKPVAESFEFETDLAAARARALDQRPEVREARLKIRQAEYDRGIKKSEYIPEVSLAFQYLSPFDISVLPKNIVSGGILVTWSPFDWGRRKKELAIRDLTLEQARNVLRETESQVAIDVGNRFRKLQESRALLRVAQLTRDTAEEKARVASNRYREKAVLLKEVLQVQTGFAEAAHNYQEAVLGFWSAKADFERALGER